MLVNEKMQTMWQKRNRSFNNPLPQKLKKIANSEIIRLYGCFLLKGTCSPKVLQRQFGKDDGSLPDRAKEHFGDRVGFEFSVSKIHIEDYVTEHFLEYALLYLKQVFEVFRVQYPELELRGMIGIDDGDEINDFYYSCTARYYVKRTEEGQIPEKPEEINKFVDAILVVDSGELDGGDTEGERTLRSQK